MRQLDLTQLQAFAAVVDTGSFTLAAKYLNRTQSAISMQLRKLEDAAGKLLLVRDKGNIRPTEEGDVLLGYARRMLKLNEDAMVALDQPFEEGHVRLGLPDDYAEYFLPEVLNRFARAFPRVQLEVVGALSGPLQDMIETGSIDLALITRQPNRPSGKVLRRERLVWAGSRQRQVHEETPLPLALFPEGCVFRGHALAALDAASIPWRIAYTSQSFAGGKLAVSGGLALTVMARSMVPQDWRIFDRQDGLPDLPEFEIVLQKASAKVPKAVKLLEQQLIECVGIQKVLS